MSQSEAWLVIYRKSDIVSGILRSYDITVVILRVYIAEKWHYMVCGQVEIASNLFCRSASEWRHCIRYVSNKCKR